jgi:hypothetical protein
MTAAVWNADVVSNFNNGVRLLAYKSADELLAANTTLQNDDHLLFAMTANDVWTINVGLHLIDASGNANFKVAFTIPSGSMMLTVTWRDTGNAITQFNWTVSGTSQTLRAVSGGQYCNIAGTVTNGATPGNFQMQWAQATSDAGNTTVKKGSSITGIKLA